MTHLNLLSGGAAQGLVTQLELRFEADHQCTIDGSFGAVGMMKDSLLAGAPCDVVILTESLVQQLADAGRVMPESVRSLGVVKTGVAVKTGDASPSVGTAADLKAALLAARGIYFPDAIKSTAGIHFMKVLKQLGLDTELAERLHPFPNGATAMSAMAEADGFGLLGCTQVTEIIYTEGVDLIAPLPDAFELATVYTAAVCTNAAEPAAANQLIGLLSGDATATLRRTCGFEPL
jgi:molybdate transport system substrate-binding protein